MGQEKKLYCICCCQWLPLSCFPTLGNDSEVACRNCIDADTEVVRQVSYLESSNNKKELLSPTTKDAEAQRLNFSKFELSQISIAREIFRTCTEIHQLLIEQLFNNTELKPSAHFNDVINDHTEKLFSGAEESIKERLLRINKLIELSNNRWTGHTVSHSCVYVLSSALIPYYKVGATNKGLRNRLRVLNTATPVNFKIVYVHSCDEPMKAEKAVFSMLHKHRVLKDKEFFDIELNKLKLCIKEAIRQTKAKYKFGSDCG